MPPKICRTLRKNNGEQYTTCFTPSNRIRGSPARLGRGNRVNGATSLRPPPAYDPRTAPPAYSLGSPPQYRDDRGSPPQYTTTAKQYLKAQRKKVKDLTPAERREYNRLLKQESRRRTGRN